MNKEKIVLSSTHLDSHGVMMTKEALESGATTINSQRSPRLGLDHDKIFPPLGRISDAKVVEGKDGEFYLIAYKEFFDKQEYSILDDGTTLYKEYFIDGGKPFVESEIEPVDKVEIKTDPVNFESKDSLDEFIKDIREDSGFDFDNKQMMRKSVLPDPEIVVKLTGIIAVTLGIIKSKIAEKVGDAIGEDVERFYKFIRACVIGMVKRAIPINRPITFVFEIHDEVLVEFIIKSNNPDEVVMAFSSSALADIQDKIKASKDMFYAEKIQFTFSEQKVWTLNYLLTKDGAVIGTKKAFDKRDKAYNGLIDKLIERENKNGCS